MPKPPLNRKPPAAKTDLPKAVTSDAYLTIPKSVRISGYDFIVEVSETADSYANGEHGHTNFLSQKIRLSPALTNQDLGNTFLHECMHAMHWLYGLDDGDTEERFTNLGANALCAFFKDNPKATAWIIKSSGSLQ